VLNSRKGNGGKKRKKEKGKVVSSYLRAGGIALRYGNCLEAACKTVKAEKAWQRKTDSKNLQGEQIEEEGKKGKR
jgi:hypothetical protein